MKILKSLIIIVFAFTECVLAQSINLRTGVDANGNLLTLPAVDAWEVAGPYTNQNSMPTSFVPAKVTNNIMLDVTSVVPPNSFPFPSQPQIGVYTYPSRWISPFVNSVNEAVFPVQSIDPAGYYAWRRTFYVPNTCIQSAVLTFSTIGVDNIVSRILVNGVSIPIPLITKWYTQNISLNLPLLPGQQNELIVETENTEEWSTFFVVGSIDMRFCGTVDLALRDANNVEQEEFCMEDDILIDPMVQGATSYYYSFYNLNNPLGVSTGIFSGNPTHIKFSQLFQGAISATTNDVFKLVLHANLSCGTISKEKIFKFKCCDNSANALFSASVKNGVLNATAVGGFTHDWKVYNMSSVTGQLSPIYQTDNRQKITKSGSVCYFIRHEITNECGTDCKSQRICELNCESTAPCEVAAPTNTQFDPVTGTFSWNSVPGITNYLLEITKCDPACCPSSPAGEDSPFGCSGPVGGGSTSVQNNVGSVFVSGTSKVLNPADFGWSFPPNCFSWRVYAVCPNGSKSTAVSNCATYQ